MPLDLEHKAEEMEKSSETRKGIWRLILPVLRNRYFLVSLAFYLALLIIFAGYRISSYMDIRGSFDEGAVLILPPMAPPPPPTPQKETKATTKEVVVNTTAAAVKTAVNRITVTAPSDFVRPETMEVMPVMKMAEVKVGTDLNKRIEGARIARLQGVAKFQKDWKVTGSKSRTTAKFTIFQAKYEDGDWNCNPTALRNLILQIRVWSQGRLDAQLHPEVLDIGSSNLFTLKPPFVYLTGHKDFHFKDNEVENLRDYLIRGGAVWADNALAGHRSRFDIAFRREMKRVLPDREFEIVPENHEMFDTFFDKIGLPSGMNYYHEPVEMINIGGELAVLYTLNGYGHFWETRLKVSDGSKIEWNKVIVGTNMHAHIRSRIKNLTGPRPIWANVYGPHATDTIVCRNINDKTVSETYKFGINVIVHLLTRYQKHFRFLPMELPTKNIFQDRPGAVTATNAAGGTTTNAAKVEEKKPPPKPKGLRGIPTRL